MKTLFRALLLLLLLLLLPSVALGAFPQVVTTSSGEQTTDVSSHALTMPASLVVGNKILCVFSVDCTSTDSECVTVAINTGVSGTNWTEGGELGTSNWNVVGAWYYKTVEGSNALTLTLSGITNTQQSSHICYQLSGAGAIDGSSFQSTGGSNSNPPSHTAAGGAADNLWVVTRSGDAQVVASAAPTNYTNLLTVTATNAQGASSNTAIRELNAATEDPGTFTSASEQYVCWTIAVAPAPSGIAVLKRGRGR